MKHLIELKLRIGKMGLNFQLAGTNKGRDIGIHIVHIINLTKKTQIVFKSLSFPYYSFKDHSSFINCFLSLNHSSHSLTSHSLFSLIDYSLISFID